MSSEVWNTASMAELLGCSEAAIRTAKSRNKEQLIEGTHWIKDETGRILWTVAGVQVLRELLKGDTQPLQDSDTPVLQQDSNEPVSMDIDARLRPLADRLAVQMLKQRLPLLVQQSLERMLYQPDTIPDDELAQVFDNVISTLGMMKATQAMFQNFKQDLAIASQQAIKQLPGGVSNG